jgi:hypothetical protein
MKSIRVEGVWTLAADMHHAQRHVLFTVVCEIGKAPRIMLDWPVDGLSLEQWDTLRLAVNRAWAAIEIRCRCGHPYYDHSHRSPHACSVLDGCPMQCVCFCAAEPLADLLKEIAP